MKHLTRVRLLSINSQSPSTPLQGLRTHYTWEDIWQPDILLNLIQNYLQLANHYRKNLDEFIQHWVWKSFVGSHQ